MIRFKQGVYVNYPESVLSPADSIPDSIPDPPSELPPDVPWPTAWCVSCHRWLPADITPPWGAHSCCPRITMPCITDGQS